MKKKIKFSIDGGDVYSFLNDNFDFDDILKAFDSDIEEFVNDEMDNKCRTCDKKCNISKCKYAKDFKVADLNSVSSELIDLIVDDYYKGGTFVKRLLTTLGKQEISKIVTNI
jgi:hypothetical protein